MSTPSELREAWALLALTGSPIGELRARELEGFDTRWGPSMVAIDAEGNRHLLFPAEPGSHITADQRSSGIHILPHPLIDRQSDRLFVDVVCLKPHLHELFSIVAGEMFDGFKEDPTHPDLSCSSVLDRWRELLEREFGQHPGMETIVGLFGELWQLREIVRENPAALSCWTGPSGARHDIAAGSIALEVKTTRARGARIFEIHGHDQLEPPLGGRLYLAGMQIEQTTVAAGQSIPDLADSIIALGANRHDLLTSISQAGVGPGDINYLSAFRFTVREVRIYSVEGDFPRITLDSFVGRSLPPAVVRLSYQLDLSGEPPHPIGDLETRQLYTTIAGATAL